jgi:hypothetical protein
LKVVPRRKDGRAATRSWLRVPPLSVNLRGLRR